MIELNAPITQPRFQNRLEKGFRNLAIGGALLGIGWLMENAYSKQTVSDFPSVDEQVDDFVMRNIDEPFEIAGNVFAVVGLGVTALGAVERWDE